ncbi:hypothetical protein NEHOM01_0579 [Nematocida homosporus]|uniref:uncharacterized protein n=1 Tax=Nematocida homosporus TaxID=1912981 RepID=UPI0022202132|nr:uncharacterized protein NEHOM01_0579 [Nematocida homosporus]KAI5185074.1 hypothetical protein NEHOM01_0579 [Nematocida homosporus]
MKYILLLGWAALVLADECTQVLDAIDAYRKDKGLSHLNRSRQLTLTARDRVEAMLAAGDLFNSTSDVQSLAKKNGYLAASLGENIGMSDNQRGSGLDIFQEWANSAVHRANLNDSSDYNEIGAYKLNGEKNLYVSVVFGRAIKEPNLAYSSPYSSPYSSLSNGAVKNPQLLISSTRSPTASSANPPPKVVDMPTPLSPANYPNNRPISVPLLAPTPAPAPTPPPKQPATPPTPPTPPRNNSPTPPTPAIIPPIIQPMPYANPPLAPAPTPTQPMPSQSTVLVTVPPNLDQEHSIVKLILVSGALHSPS